MSHKYPGGIRECYCGSHYVSIWTNVLTDNGEKSITCMECGKNYPTGEYNNRFALKKWNNRLIEENAGRYLTKDGSKPNW